MRDFLVKHKKIVTAVLLVAGIIAGLTATNVDDQLVEDLKRVNEALTADIHLRASDPVEAE